MSSAESRLKPDHQIQLSHAAGVVQPTGSESKKGPRTTTASQTESLLAADRREHGTNIHLGERKRAEDELRKAFEKIAKSEAELRTIIDAIPQLITAIGTDGDFLYANQAVQEYTGLTKEELRLECSHPVFHPEDSERLRDEREAAISRRVPFEYERRIRRKDGQFRWFLVQYKPKSPSWLASNKQTNLTPGAPERRLSY
jgi:PAS domain S-box-containing protein